MRRQAWIEVIRNHTEQTSPNGAESGQDDWILVEGHIEVIPIGSGGDATYGHALLFRAHCVNTSSEDYLTLHDRGKVIKGGLETEVSVAYVPWDNIFAIRFVNIQRRNESNA